MELYFRHQFPLFELYTRTVYLCPDMECESAKYDRLL